MKSNWNRLFHLIVASAALLTVFGGALAESTTPAPESRAAPMSIDLAFMTHLDMDLPEQDVYIERVAGSSEVFRVTKGDNGAHADYWSASGHQAFLEDLGRGRVTVREEDRYKFRTPSLRNVAQTGPWGHDGAYEALEAVVRHHLAPIESLHAYVVTDELLPPLEVVLETTANGSSLDHDPLSGNRLEGFLLRDGWVQSNPELRGRIAAANELPPVPLSDAQVGDLVAFLESLTDDRSEPLADLIPESVPSGLPVND